MTTVGDNGRVAYITSVSGERLYQGEIVSNVVERVVTCGGHSDNASYNEFIHPYMVVVTQDCDLQQDDRERRETAGDDRRRKLLPWILLVEAFNFEETAPDLFAGREIKKQAKQNKVERYQFLASVSSIEDADGQGVPSLVLDFRLILSYPTKELFDAFERGETRRRARLNALYAEHLSNRCAHFLQRIGLPVDHHDLP